MQVARCITHLLSRRQTLQSILSFSGSMVRTGPYASIGLETAVLLEIPADEPGATCNTGGPGCSSIGGGFLSELGPFYPTKGEGLVNSSQHAKPHPPCTICWISSAQNSVHLCGLAAEYTALLFGNDRSSLAPIVVGRVLRSVLMNTINLWKLVVSAKASISGFTFMITRLPSDEGLVIC